MAEIISEIQLSVQCYLQFKKMKNYIIKAASTFMLINKGNFSIFDPFHPAHLLT